MHVDDAPRTRALVQVVDVLGDEGEAPAAPVERAFEPGEREMRRVRLGAHEVPAAQIIECERRFGVAALAAGKRRDRLAEAFENEILRLFAGRILSFDLKAARAYASLMSAARGGGHSISLADGQIAAIAAANGFSVATRDEAPFRAARLNVVNPWAE